MERINYLGNALLQGVRADITEVSADGNTVYLGFRGKTQSQNDLPEEERSDWRIEKIVITNDENGQTIRTLYPNGSKMFGYSWAMRKTYSYTYSH